MDTDDRMAEAAAGSAGRADGLVASWLPPIVAGLVAVLVGYTSSAVLIFQAAATAGATPAQTGSWLLAFGVAIAEAPAVPAGAPNRLHFARP